jgi:ABC-type multidrug transport system fused ATPase/permease subunit
MISRTHIPDQREGEKVVLHFRRHWFIFLNLFLVYFGLSLLPVIVVMFLGINNNVNIFDFINNNEFIKAVALVIGFVYYLAMLVFTFTMWTENYLDVWTLTSERIINREQKGLFNRVVSELGLSSIQDITVEQKGIFATILQYGDVYVQTAAEKERFVFQKVPNPYHISKIIQQLNEQAKQKQNYPNI